MHIDKRHWFISIRATHLYMEKHITSCMTNNRWSPCDIHCESSYRNNNWFTRRTFSCYNIRSFSYSNVLSCDHVENHVNLPVVVGGDNCDKTYMHCTWEVSTMSDNVDRSTVTKTKVHLVSPVSSPTWPATAVVLISTIPIANAWYLCAIPPHTSLL